MDQFFNSPSLRAVSESDHLSETSSEGSLSDCDNSASPPSPSSVVRNLVHLTTASKKRKRPVPGYAPSAACVAAPAAAARAAVPAPRARSKNKSSAYRGVSRCAKDGRWQARIRVGRTVKYLGRYKTEIEAARCYDRAAVQMHGSRAVLNERMLSGLINSAPSVVAVTVPSVRSAACNEDQAKRRRPLVSAERHRSLAVKLAASFAPAGTADDMRAAVLGLMVLQQNHNAQPPAGLAY